MRDAVGVARPMWTLYEPVHAVSYFAPQARAAFEDAGLRGFWRGYFAGRAAPLGAVGPAPVVAAFFGFAPAMVERALPDVWTRATPERTLAARTAGAVAALRDLVGDLPVDRAADLMWRAVDGLDCAGRVLAAANAALSWPSEPLARLWQAATLLREHRGDGHVAALVAAGVTGREAVVWRAGIDGSRAVMQVARGWTDEQWDAAVAALVERRWLDADGTCTDAGRARYAEVEATTDLAAAAPWRRLGPDGTARLAELLYPIAVACAAGLPYPNPIGLPVPLAPSAAVA
jgi:hypothetical protein